MYLDTILEKKLYISKLKSILSSTVKMLQIAAIHNSLWSVGH